MYKLELQSGGLNRANRLFGHSSHQSGRAGAAVIAPYHRRLIHGYAVERIGAEAVFMLLCDRNNSPARATDGKEGSR
jgi:hypothetical protein